MRKSSADHACLQASRRAKIARLAQACDKTSDDAWTRQLIEKIGVRLSVPAAAMLADVRTAETARTSQSQLATGRQRQCPHLTS